MSRSRFLSWLSVALLPLLLVSTITAATDNEWRWSDVDRIVVLPDIHGAYAATVRLLQHSGIVDDSLAWSGGRTHLVSLGDLLDRGPESRKVMDLLMRLQQQSQAADGRVHVVAGNHELMNLIGDLRYVSREEYAAFADTEPDGARENALARFRSRHESEFATELDLNGAFDKEYPSGFFGHRAAFGPDGLYGRWLLSLPALIVVNDIAFAHGGLPSIVAERSLTALNQEYRNSVTAYLKTWRELVDLGLLPDNSNRDAAELARARSQNAEPSTCIAERQQLCERVTDDNGDVHTTYKPAVRALLEKFVELSDTPILGIDGPLWYRGAVLCRDILERPILDAALGNLAASKLVVGHTITADKVSHSIHDDRLIMLDTGMLASYYDGRPAALIIENGETVVQYLDPDERHAPVKDGRYLAYKLTSPELEEALRSGNVSRISASSGTPSQIELSFRGKTIHASFYPHSRSNFDNKELAAYELSTIIGLDLVPMTIEREIDGTRGALQLRYPDAISEADRQAKQLQFGGWCSIPDQLQLMYAWDLLLANSGRSLDNLLFRSKSWTLHVVDHQRAFSSSKRLPKAASTGALTLAPGVRAALEALTEDELQAKIGTRLNKKQIRALLSRRDKMLKLF